MNLFARIAAVALFAGLLPACQSVPEQGDVEKARAEIDEHEKASLEKLYAATPESKGEIEGAVGHAVFNVDFTSPLL